MDLQQMTIQGLNVTIGEDKEHTHQNEPGVTESSINWHKCGNHYYSLKKYKDAIVAYARGIEGGDDSIDLLANRSAANMALAKYKVALDDAELVVSINKNHIKCIFRKVKALFGLKLYRDAMVFLETFKLESIPRNDGEIITDLMNKAKSFIAQSENGDYPWMDLYEGENIYHEMADYTSSVTIKEVPLKGRGLFATKSIKAGELILASKAFVYLQDNVPTPCTNPIHISPFTQTDLLIAEINMRLVQKIAQLLENDPDKCQDLYRLYAGPKLGYLDYEKGAVSNDFQVNEDRIESIFVYNGVSSHKDVDGAMMINSGIWITPSFLNHSCVDANSTWLNIGDFLFVRAFRNISEGDEISISYKAPNGIIAQKELDVYGFKCICRLCERDASDNETVRANRDALFSQLKTITEKFKEPSSLRMQKNDELEILRILKLFEQSRRDAPELNCCLTNELLVFGIFRFENMDFMKAANTFENLYSMIENVPAFFLNTVDACIHIALAYLTIRKTQKGKYWLRILKQKTIFAYGTEKVLDVKYATYMELIRGYGVNV